MKPLHKELQDIRIEKGVTIQDIYRETKIRTQILEKIEEGDFTQAPEPFMRAFLREYAMVIGVDPGRVIAKYEGKAASVRDDDVAMISSEEMEEHPSGRESPAGSAQREADHSPADSKESDTDAPSPRVADAQSMDAAPPPPLESAAARPAAEIISDSAESRPEAGEAAFPAGKSLDSIYEEPEKKSPRLLFMIIFGLIIIAATLAILSINGILRF